MLKLFAGVLAASVLFTSCSIEQNFHFRSDFSGTYEIRVDMSAMESFADMDSTAAEEPDSMFTAEDIREFRTFYNGIEGISNADASYEEGVLDASYDFASLDALNRAQDSSPDNEDLEEGEAPAESPRLFIFKRTSNGLEIDVDRGFMNSETEESSEEDIQMMDGMLTISGIMSFEKKVKSVSGDIATLDAENNTVTIKVLFSDIYNKEKNLTTVIGF